MGASGTQVYHAVNLLKVCILPEPGRSFRVLIDVFYKLNDNATIVIFYKLALDPREFIESYTCVGAVIQ